MRHTLSPRDRRTLTIGGAVILAILILGRLAPAAIRFIQDQTATDDRLLLEHARAIEEAKSLPELRDSMHARRLRLGEEFPTLLHGNGDAALVAALVAEVNEEASDNAVFVSSIEAHANTTSHLPFTPVNARAEIVGDVRGIAGLLSAIESSDTRMRITELSLTQSDPAAAPAEVELLHATLSIQALGPAPNPSVAELSHATRKVHGVTAP